MRTKWMAAAVMAVGLGSGAAHAGDLKFSGKVFSDFSYRQNVDDGANTASADNGTQFDLKRFYLTADYTYNDFVSARFRTDIGDKGAKRFDVFVKNAYLQLKLSPELWVRAGVADNPWIPWAEDRYGFRYVENTLIDRTNFGASADWGLHVGGDLAKGMVSYQVSVVNGRGYSDPARSQAPTVEARVSAQPVKNLFVGVGGLVGTLGQKKAGIPTAQTAGRVNGLVAYTYDRVHVGAEMFYGKNDAGAIVTGKAPSDSELGFSGYASVLLAETLKPTVFGRFDFVKPSNDVDSDLQDTYFNVGLELTPWAPVNLALVYKREQVSTGAAPATFSTTNGAIGSKVANSSGTYNELGLWAQLNF